MCVCKEYMCLNKLQTHRPMGGPYEIAIEIGSGSWMFMNIGSDLQKLISGIRRHTDSKVIPLAYIHLFFQNKESRLSTGKNCLSGHDKTNVRVTEKSKWSSVWLLQRHYGGSQRRASPLTTRQRLSFCHDRQQQRDGLAWNLCQAD